MGESGWPSEAGLGGLGGQGLAQLHGPPIPSSPLIPGAGQKECLTILGLGVSGRDVPSPACRSPGMGGRGISGQSPGPAGGIRRAESTRGRGGV